jgi:hypothetical protein
MLDQLLDLAKSHLGEQFHADPEVDNEIAPNAAEAASSSIITTIMDQVKGGNLGAITEMLSGGNTDASHPEVQNLMPNVASNLASQLGIGQDAANGIAGKALPLIMNMLNGKVKSAQNEGGLDVAGLLGQLAGGAQGGGGGMLSNLVGSVLGGSGGGIGSLVGKLLGGK